MEKQKSFGQCHICTAFRIVKNYDQLYCTGEFKKASIKANMEVLNKYECLEKYSLFDLVEKTSSTQNALITVKKLSRHWRRLQTNE